MFFVEGQFSPGGHDKSIGSFLTTCAFFGDSYPQYLKVITKNVVQCSSGISGTTCVLMVCIHTFLQGGCLPTINIHNDQKGYRVRNLVIKTKINPYSLSENFFRAVHNLLQNKEPLRGLLLPFSGIFVKGGTFCRGGRGKTQHVYCSLMFSEI